MIGLEEADRRIVERLNEKRALADALAAHGLIAEPPDFAAPPTDAFAAAVHAFLASSGSLFASAQADDLAGERTATNLPGTDRERPNWRHKLALDVEALFASPRAQGHPRGDGGEAALARALRQASRRKDLRRRNVGSGGAPEPTPLPGRPSAPICDRMSQLPPEPRFVAAPGDASEPAGGAPPSLPDDQALDAYSRVVTRSSTASARASCASTSSAAAATPAPARASSSRPTASR